MRRGLSILLFCISLLSASPAQAQDQRLREGSGILKETSADKEGEKEDRLFLEVAYYTPLAGSL